MSDGVSLSHLHEVPYSQIEGAYVKVNQEAVSNRVRIHEQPETHTETREGKIVGRGNGTGTYYDSVEKAVMTHSIGPAIYIETPEDTILEVRTDKTENELVDYQNNE